MKAIIHKADSRKYFDHSWLKTYHTFSFGDYYDPLRVRFGALRVLNDDTLAPSKGFGNHSHSDMEIVTIPLSGMLEHRDSMGNISDLYPGDIQVMSAGTGILHSEYNTSPDEPAEFLQIWVLPEEQNVMPRYRQARVEKLIVRNQISELVHPYPGEEQAKKDKGLWIHQKAWFSMAKLNKGIKVTYHLHTPESFGVYIFMIEGSAKVADHMLDKRDGMGISETKPFVIQALTEATILLIEVPASFK